MVHCRYVHLKNSVYNSFWICNGFLQTEKTTKEMRPGNEVEDIIKWQRQKTTHLIVRICEQIHYNTGLCIPLLTQAILQIWKDTSLHYTLEPKNRLVWYKTKQSHNTSSITMPAAPFTFSLVWWWRECHCSPYNKLSSWQNNRSVSTTSNYSGASAGRRDQTLY